MFYFFFITRRKQKQTAYAEKTSEIQEMYLLNNIHDFVFFYLPLQKCVCVLHIYIYRIFYRHFSTYLFYAQQKHRRKKGQAPNQNQFFIYVVLRLDLVVYANTMA